MHQFYNIFWLFLNKGFLHLLEYICFLDCRSQKKQVSLCCRVDENYIANVIELVMLFCIPVLFKLIRYFCRWRNVFNFSRRQENKVLLYWYRFFVLGKRNIASWVERLARSKIQILVVSVGFQYESVIIHDSLFMIRKFNKNCSSLWLFCIVNRTDLFKSLSNISRIDVFPFSKIK